jgi:hypothetical protein
MAVMYEVSWLGIIIAAVVSFIVGFLWYGPLFGKLWMKLNNVTMKDIQKDKERGMGWRLILALITSAVTAWAIGVLLVSTGTTTLAGAFGLVVLVWLGFLVATTLLGSVMWDQKSWGLFFFNAIYWLINLEIMAVILKYF